MICIVKSVTTYENATILMHIHIQSEDVVQWIENLIAITWILEISNSCASIWQAHTVYRVKYSHYELHDLSYPIQTKTLCNHNSLVGAVIVYIWTLHIETPPVNVCILSHLSPSPPLTLSLCVHVSSLHTLSIEFHVFVYTCLLSSMRLSTLVYWVPCVCLHIILALGSHWFTLNNTDIIQYHKHSTSISPL